MVSDIFSAIITVGAVVWPEIRVGITPASTTRNPPIPWTFKFVSTTELLGLVPILVVPTGWKSYQKQFYLIERKPYKILTVEARYWKKQYHHSLDKVSYESLHSTGAVTWYPGLMLWKPVVWLSFKASWTPWYMVSKSVWLEKKFGLISG